MHTTFYVWAKWDDEAGVWYTSETSIPGLHTSGDTLEELRQRLLLIIPDFLEDQMPAMASLRIFAESDDEFAQVAAE